ncbi:MAG TPA: aminoglycoside phosphotransferase family protein [Thermoprotei archaeon]|nr:aminoglycoside phosphotransferase family protein [Thermoprotei archaeon]
MIPRDYIEAYFKELIPNAREIKIVGREDRDVKGYGYGEPITVMVDVDGEVKKYVISTVKEDRFGHEYISDRAGEILWSYKAFNNLPNHVRAVDVGYISSEGRLNSVKDFDEFFIVTEYVEGRLYKDFLFEISGFDRPRKVDEEVVDKLVEYLYMIHRNKPNVDPWLYIRRIRDLIGDGECIMGLIDSYLWSGKEVIDKEFLEEVEVKSVRWRWKLRSYMDRLSIVHGDFHPWNIIIDGDLNITVLDRSRGDYGEPADDVAALTINYIFISLLTRGRFEDPYRWLYKRFIKRYIDLTGDHNLLNVIQPFYTWRALVVANPIWYPDIDPEIRMKILRFASEILDHNVVSIDLIDELVS